MANPSFEDLEKHELERGVWHKFEDEEGTKGIYSPLLDKAEVGDFLSSHVAVEEFTIGATGFKVRNIEAIIRNQLKDQEAWKKSWDADLPHDSLYVSVVKGDNVIRVRVVLAFEMEDDRENISFVVKPRTNVDELMNLFPSRREEILQVFA